MIRKSGNRFSDKIVLTKVVLQTNKNETNCRDQGGWPQGRPPIFYKLVCHSIGTCS